MDKPKILFFIESLQCGGAEKSLVSLLQLIDYDKYDVDLMMLRGDGIFSKYVPERVNIIPFPKPKSRILNRLCQTLYSIKWRVLPMLERRRHNAENRWPVVAAALGRLPGRYDIAIAYQQGFPTYYLADHVDADKKVAWVNIDLEAAGYRPDFNRRFYDKYDNVVAVSEELYSRLQQSDYVDASRLVTIYDILNVDFIRQMSSAPVDEPANITPSTVKLVTVGRLSKQKNYPLAVMTALELKKRGVDFVWTFVGDGAERPAVEDLIDRYSLRREVRLAGLQENPYPYMAQADIYVHTASFEGYGLTIAEAKILGKPVVSTDFPIIFDQITDGVNGMIARQTPDSLADKIQDLISDATLRRAITEQIGKETNSTAETEIKKFYTMIER